MNRHFIEFAPGHEDEAIKKLWLWKNFVGGRPEYWAFDNAFPVHLDCGDPQTLGEPCGYALLKPSRDGRPGFPDDEVLRRIAAARELPADQDVAAKLRLMKLAPRMLDMLRELLTTREAEARATLTWENAAANFSDAKPEGRALAVAMDRASAAERKARALIAAAEGRSLQEQS